MSCFAIQDHERRAGRLSAACSGQPMSAWAQAFCAVRQWYHLWLPGLDTNWVDLDRLDLDMLNSADSDKNSVELDMVGLDMLNLDRSN